MERRAINYEKKANLSMYLQQIKAKATCVNCGENHPAALQFHHRDPSQKEFNISEFVTHQLGGMEKLKKEIEKCDIICANCHLKYHYSRDHRQSRISVETASNLFERTNQELVPNLGGSTDTVYNNYFPEGIDPVCLTVDFYESLRR